MRFTPPRVFALGTAFGLAVAGLTAALAADFPAAKAALYFEAAAVKAAFAKQGGDNFYSVPGGPQSLVVRAGHRIGAGTTSELHEETTDVLYIVSGTATLVTGGTMVDIKETGPGEHRGSRVEGGTEQALKPGDLVIIPPKTPHWFKAIPTDLQYFTVLSK